MSSSGNTSRPWLARRTALAVVSGSQSFTVQLFKKAAVGFAQVLVYEGNTHIQTSMVSVKSIFLNIMLILKGG
jgi:hypothetical protein